MSLKDFVSIAGKSVTAQKMSSMQLHVLMMDVRPQQSTTNIALKHISKVYDWTSMFQWSIFAFISTSSSLFMVLQGVSATMVLFSL
jgi:hypothetical protein